MEEEQPAAPQPPADPPAAPGRGWLTKQLMAEVLDVTEQHFDRSFRPLAPPSAVKTESRRVYFHARTLLDAWLASHTRPTAPNDPLLDNLLDGPESDSLDELRKVKTAQERIRLAEMEGRVIPRDELDPALAKLASIQRQTGQAIQRQFGNDAAQLFNEMADEWERALATMFAGRPAPTAAAAPAPPPEHDRHAPRPAPDGGPDPRAAAAVDA